MAAVLLSFLLTISFSHAQTVSCSGGNCYCPSSSSGTTCTLSCIGKDICKDSTLVCRAGDPCTVLCYGESSCEGNTMINGLSATEVSVTCSGTNACKGNTIVNCGTASCNIQCGSESCEDLTASAPFATSLSCSGSCGDASIAQFANPTPKPTPSPTDSPTLGPTSSPTPEPTSSPTPSPTDSPSTSPTPEPTPSPTPSPTLSPSNPTAPPSNRPTLRPTANPSVRPTLSPSTPTTPPTKLPSLSPTPSPVSDSVDVQAQVIATEVATDDTSATLYIFVACGVLIVCGSAVCCLGIYVHYTSKRRHVKDLHSEELEMNRVVSRSPQSFAQRAGKGRASKQPRPHHVSRRSDSNALYATVPMGRQPEPDGLMASQMTVPRRQMQQGRAGARAMYQNVPRQMAGNVGAVDVEAQAMNEIRSGYAQRRRKKQRKERFERQRAESEMEKSDSRIFNDLASCGSGMSGDGNVDEVRTVRTMHQRGVSNGTAEAAYARAQNVCRMNLGVPPPQVTSPSHVPPYLRDNHGVSAVMVHDETR